MESIFELFLEGIILYLFTYPGAFFLWLITGCKRPFKQILDGYPYGNAGIGVLFIGSIVILIKYLLSK